MDHNTVSASGNIDNVKDDKIIFDYNGTAYNINTNDLFNNIVQNDEVVEEEGEQEEEEDGDKINKNDCNNSVINDDESSRTAKGRWQIIKLISCIGLLSKTHNRNIGNPKTNNNHRSTEDNSEQHNNSLWRTSYQQQVYFFFSFTVLY